MADDVLYNCTDKDELNWNATNSNFDADMELCAINCPWAQLLAGKVSECMQKCMSSRFGRSNKIVADIYSGKCSYCFGEWAACMINQDPCTCYLGRGTSDNCEKCSRDNCEGQFLNCSGFAEFPGLPKTLPPKGFELPQEAVYGIAGGSFILVMLGISAIILGIRRSIKSKRDMKKSGLHVPKGLSSKDLTMTPTGLQMKKLEPQSSFSLLESGSSPKSTFGNAPSNLWIAKYDSSPGAEDEIAVSKGAKLEWVRDVDSDWAWVKEVATAKQGLIPKNIISKL